MAAGVSIKNLTRREAPRFPYAAIASAVLPNWEISLAFVGPAEAAKLNKQLRHKAYVPNVLSYEAGEKSGEIIICLAEAARQAPAHGMSVAAFTLRLFIHGLLHLKGWAHGVTMDRREQQLVARFAASTVRTSLSHGTTHNNRNRHRDLPGQGRRRRGTHR